MVVLSAAQCPSPSLTELNKAVNLSRPINGVLWKRRDFILTRTSRDGVFVSGSASGPSDICETVLKSSAAACEAAAVIASSRKQAEIKPIEHEHKTDRG